MATSKRGKRQQQRGHDDDDPVASKEDWAITKYLRSRVPTRQGDIHGMEVNCFYGEDAVNCLLDSRWATGSDAKFSDRKSCVSYCDELLHKKMYHRAVLVKRKKPKSATAASDTGNDTPADSGAEGKKKKKTKPTESAVSEKKEETAKKPKKLKKLKLDMCDPQYFSDGKEIFVWIYDPTSWKSLLIGLLIVFGSIGMCLYPLWPPEVRVGVYYLSLTGAGFLGVIISLAIFRYIVYGIVYALTFGKHRFMLFPNLTEDCGFFESFVPVYEYSQAGDLETDQKKKKKNKGDIKSLEESADQPVEPEVGEVAEDEQQSEESNEDFEVIQSEEISAK